MLENASDHRQADQQTRWSLSPNAMKLCNIIVHVGAANVHVKTKEPDAVKDQRENITKGNITSCINILLVHTDQDAKNLRPVDDRRETARKESTPANQP